MDTTQANKTITSLYSDIRATVGRIVGTHWRFHQNATTRDDTVDEVTQYAICELLAKSLPKYDESKRQRKGAASLRTFVLSCAANYARNWRKAHCNRPHSEVNVTGETAPEERDSDSAESRAVMLADDAPDAFAAMTRAVDVAKLRAAMAKLEGNDKALVDGLLAGTPKGQIAKSLGKSNAWVTYRWGIVRERLAAEVG